MTHPDLSRYIAACDYPGIISDAQVERSLAEYLDALGIKREIRRLKRGWDLSTEIPLAEYIAAVLSVFSDRSSQSARSSQVALSALSVRDAQSARGVRHRFATWAILSGSYYWYRFDLSWISTTWLGAKTEKVKAWSKPLFESYCSGAWMLHWTKDVLYWIAKPVVLTEKTRTGKRLHSDASAAIVSDVEDLYFCHGVLVPSFVVTDPDSISVEHIRTETNAEVRRIMIERMGPERYLKEAGSKLIDMDCLKLVGSAPRALVQDSLGDKWLIGTDGSTKRVYYMPVPSEVMTCREAHNAIAGCDETSMIAEC